MSVVWQKVMRSGIQTDGVGGTARATIKRQRPRCL
jgi:hypothetical protein